MYYIIIIINVILTYTHTPISGLQNNELVCAEMRLGSPFSSNWLNLSVDSLMTDPHNEWNIKIGGWSLPILMQESIATLWVISPTPLPPYPSLSVPNDKPYGFCGR